MELRLSDIEANAVKHALEQYLKGLDKSAGEKKGMTFEKDAVKNVIQKMMAGSGASGT